MIEHGKSLKHRFQPAAFCQHDYVNWMRKNLVLLSLGNFKRCLNDPGGIKNAF